MVTVNNMRNDGDFGDVEVDGRNIEGRSYLRSPSWVERVINEEMQRKYL